jgi:hypothetical protein
MTAGDALDAHHPVIAQVLNAISAKARPRHAAAS